MTNVPLPSKILIVDDDPTVAHALEEPLARQNVSLLKASTLENAMYIYNQNRFDVVLVELEFATLPGLALIQKWRQHEIAEKRCTGFIVISGSSRTASDDALVREMGDIEVILKPFNVMQLTPFLKRAVVTKQRLIQFADLKNKLIEPYSQRGDLPKAIEAIQKKMPELGMRGVPILLDLYEKANQLEQALPLATNLCEKDPKNISYLNSKGRILLRMGKYEQAREALEIADKMAPTNIERINEIAEMYLKLNEPGKSVKRMKELMALNPEKPDLKFDMFSKLYDHGFETDATEFGRSVCKPMEIVRHYNNKGVLLSKNGDTAGAIVEYKRALKFFPKYRENYRIHFNIALAKMQTKTAESFREAEEHLNVCIELEPGFDKAKKAMETVQKALGKKAS